MLCYNFCRLQSETAQDILKVSVFFSQCLIYGKRASSRKTEHSKFAKFIIILIACYDPVSNSMTHTFFHTTLILR